METNIEHTAAPSVEALRFVMPACPYCKTEMNPAGCRGYYDSFAVWGCRCEKHPNAKVPADLMKRWKIRAERHRAHAANEDEDDYIRGMFAGYAAALEKVVSEARQCHAAGREV